MAGFSSQDDLISEMTVNGKFFRADWNKNFLPTSAAVAGEWHSLFRGNGNPGPDAILNTGTNLAFQALTDATTNATGIPHGGNVGGGTGFKHLLTAAAQTAAATTAPCVLMLVDLLGFYPITTVTTTSAQTLNNTVTLPRYTDGAGVQAFLTPSTVMGAATPNLSLSSYTNSAGTASRATPTTLPIGNTAAAVTSIVYSGTGSGKYGPFMPLQAGDAGVRSVQTVTIATSYVSGVLNLVLCKPLATLPITTLGVTAERDLVNQFASMPKVYDGACLAWLMLAGGATPVGSALSGHLELGWS